MANIRLNLGSPVDNGQVLTFKSPADCSAIDGLIVYYPEGDALTSKVFQFADAHGNNVGSLNLFAENVLVKVILDTELNRAYVQNADTNAYLEARFKTIQEPTYTEATTLAKLTSGEKLSVAFGKIAKAVTDLISHLSSKSNPHGVTASQVGARPNTWTPTASDVGLGNVPNVSTNNQTPTFTQATTLSQLTSGETLSALFGKVAKAITDLISHLSNKSNPHGVTAAQVGASATGHKHTKSEITDFPTSMTPTSHKHTKSEITDFPSSMPASDVYSWAKASSKPSYSWSEITSKPTTFTPSTHTHGASDINSGTLSSDRLPTVPVAKGGTGATTEAAARTNLGIKSETWTFTLEDGSTITKVVYVG